MTRILIVDDEPDIRESLEVMLAKKGHEILTAASGNDGFEAALREQPDMVLLDVMLPEVNGFDVCKRLKADESTRHIPVLLLTALNDMDDKVKGLEAGADDFVTKPFNDAELRARVNAFLRTKKLRDELDASYKKLQRLEQMRESLSHMLVHDLKAPLTAIMGGIGVVLEHIQNDAVFPAPLKKLLKNAHNGSKRLIGLIQDILDVNRLEEARLPLEKKPTDVGALVRESTEMLDAAAQQANVKIIITIDEKTRPVSIDAVLIQRVLCNLISNALKFTEAGGSVHVGARPAENELELRVTDTGVGIPKDHLEKIFDKFFQADRHEASRKGQGLGLAFCRLAVESHGGRIWAENGKEKGSRFVLRLPVQ